MEELLGQLVTITVLADKMAMIHQGMLISHDTDFLYLDKEGDGMVTSAIGIVNVLHIELAENTPDLKDEFTDDRTDETMEELAEIFGKAFGDDDDKGNLQ